MGAQTMVQASSFQASVRGAATGLAPAQRIQTSVVREKLFFPVGDSDGPPLEQINEAKKVCRICPVVDQCLAWALETGQDAGVWGRLSDVERRELRRRGGRSLARTA